MEISQMKSYGQFAFQKTTKVAGHQKRAYKVRHEALIHRLRKKFDKFSVIFTVATKRTNTFFKYFIRV